MGVKPKAEEMIKDSNYKIWACLGTVIAGGAVTSLAVPSWPNNQLVFQGIFLRKISVHVNILSAAGAPVNYSFGTVITSFQGTQIAGVAFGNVNPIYVYNSTINTFTVNKIIMPRTSISVSSTIYGSFALNDVVNAQLHLVYRDLEQ